MFINLILSPLNFNYPSSYQRQDMSDLKDLVVEVKRVSKSYGTVHAVTDASFTIRRGECFGLLGPNGAGKSTLIRMLYGASSRSSGEMRVLGLDPATDGRKLRQKIGVVTQEDALDEAMSVAENMKMFARFLGVPKDVAEP